MKLRALKSHKKVASLHKKWNFPLGISSLSFPLRISLTENFIFCAVHLFQEDSKRQKKSLNHSLKKSSVIFDPYDSYETNSHKKHLYSKKHFDCSLNPACELSCEKDNGASNYCLNNKWYSRIAALRYTICTMNTSFTFYFIKKANKLMFHFHMCLVCITIHWFSNKDVRM